LTLQPLSQITDVMKRHDTPKSHTQQGKFTTYPAAMSGVLGSGLLCRKVVIYGASNRFGTLSEDSLTN
jgi:hypothetical protein